MVSNFSFMNDLDRVARRDYFATESDIIRAPLRTVGIHEYQITICQEKCNDVILLYCSQKSTLGV
jgi:hypothetical protein